MLDISLEKNMMLYLDYAEALRFLRELDHSSFTYPPEKVPFHIYSEVRSEKELLSVESYFATQNLERTKLILWSDYDVTGNPLLRPFRDLIDFRVYDVEQEVLNTPLEGSEKWITADDSKHYMRSGILRFLVTHNHGGVWMDMDMVLLNDFKPILDQEWAYMWGAELDFSGFGPCAALMSYRKCSDLSKLCLEKAAIAEVIPNSTVLDHQLLAKVYSQMKFTVFPSAFFNTEWQMNTIWSEGKRIYDPNGLGTQTESGWFTKNSFSESLFTEAFAWHWHNSSYKNHQIEAGSKFNLLSVRIKAILKERGIYS